jgi:ketosteroid isomerase-like protein
MTVHAPEPVEVVLRFIDCINAGDVAALAEMMTATHRFIDSEGVEHHGRDRMELGWRDYFRIVPDYAIDVERVFSEGCDVVILGTARGTYSRDGRLSAGDAWSTPAAWYARVEGALVQEWRVYADNDPIRRRMGAE